MNTAIRDRNHRILVIDDQQAIHDAFRNILLTIEYLTQQT